jgi:DNA-binding NtrC family response regulator
MPKRNKMKKMFTILVADRNPHVRKLLKRELASEGFRVRVAENATKLLRRAYQTEPIDLIILDPDFFDEDQNALIKQLQNRIPMLPVVIHSFQSDDETFASDFRQTYFIEKREDSIEQLKNIANDLLQK